MVLKRIKQAINNKWAEIKEDYKRRDEIRLAAKKIEREVYYDEKRKAEIKKAKQRAKQRANSGDFSFLKGLVGDSKQKREQLTIGDLFGDIIDGTKPDKKRKKYKPVKEIDINKLI